MTDPTPADAARDVIARIFHDRRCPGPCLVGPTAVDYGQADRLISDLTAAGYEIVQRGAGVRVSDPLPIGARVHVYDRMGHGIDGEITDIDYVIDVGDMKITRTRKWIEPIPAGAGKENT